MNPIKIRSMKALKLLGLLISAMIIATASAALYSQMFMYSHVTVVGHFCKFTEGANTTYVGGNIASDGEEVKFTDMKGCNGSLVTYVQAVNITNGSSTESRTIELKLQSWNGEGQFKLRYINVTMYDGNTQKGEMLKLLPGAGDVTTSGKVEIAANGKWRIQWDIFWWGNATAGTDTVDITLVLIEY
ncbi:MAG: hypothetical protein ACUVRA_03150 [Candidatus Bathyarchaeaceae archaeon]